MQFNETQKFRQGWLYAVLALTFFGVVAMPMIAAWKTQQQGIEWAPFIGGFMVLSVAALLYFSHLDTRIDYSGIRLNYKPFLWKEKVWNWGDIKEAYVRTYDPILEYGGWGVRYTLSNGRAYNIRGRKGLQLLLENGKKILIGTQKPEELEQLLQYLRTHHKLNIGQAYG